MGNKIITLPIMGEHRPGMENDTIPSHRSIDGEPDNSLTPPLFLIVTVPCASLIIADSSFLALTSGEVVQKLRARGSRCPIYASPDTWASGLLPHRANDAWLQTMYRRVPLGE